MELSRRLPCVLLAAAMWATASGCTPFGDPEFASPSTDPASNMAPDAVGWLEVVNFEMPVWVHNRRAVNVAGLNVDQDTGLKAALPPGKYSLWVGEYRIPGIRVRRGETVVVDAHDYVGTVHITHARQRVLVRDVPSTRRGSAFPRTRVLLSSRPVLQLPPGHYDILVGRDPWKSVSRRIQLRRGEVHTFEMDQHFGFLDLNPVDMRWRLTDAEGSTVDCCTLEPGTYWIVSDGFTLTSFAVEAGGVVSVDMREITAILTVTGIDAEPHASSGRLVLRAKDRDPGDAAAIHLGLGSTRPRIIPPGHYEVTYEGERGGAGYTGVMKELVAPPGSEVPYVLRSSTTP